jgi:hypothetical protein
MQERISTNRHAGQLSLVLERSGEGVKRGDEFKFAPLVVASVVGEIRR